MVLKDITLSSPEENILLDDVFLTMAEEGRSGEVLRFWESRTDFIVLGRTGKVREDIKNEDVSRDGIPVLRRSSGGGTVFQGKGCLNYALILSKQKFPLLNDLRKSYVYISNKITGALKKENLEIFFRPPSDLVVGPEERKFSGNAQRRLRTFILHHGTFLYDFSIEKMERYLNIPKEVPSYRKGRPHGTFVTNIALSPGQIKEHFRHAFGVMKEEKNLTKREQECLNKLKKIRGDQVLVRI